MARLKKRAARARAAKVQRAEMVERPGFERRCWKCKGPLNGGRQSCPDCQQAFVDNGYSWGA